jgi:hypothetical protein
MRGERWTERELARLVGLREKHCMTWSAIAELFPGRTIGACTIAYHMIGVRRSRDAARAAALALAPAPLKIRTAIAHRVLAPAPARAMPPASPHVVATSRLVADAELRDRIAGRGLTAGFFGDPAPGRSALDRKRAGEAAR